MRNQKIGTLAGEQVSGNTSRVYVEFIIGACNRRQLDAQNIAVYFRKNGYRVVSKPSKADFIMLITCGVSIKREESSINRIKRLQKCKGKLIVCGCLPGINGKKLTDIFDGDIIPTSELPYIDQYFPKLITKYNSLEDSNKYFPFFKTIFSKRFLQTVKYKSEIFRALSLKYILKVELPQIVKNTIGKNRHYSKPFSIRVSWGCNQNCAYCGIKFAIGHLRSKPIETCLNEFQKGLNLGYKNFEIIADDIGAYGNDTGKSFPDLLKQLFSVQGEYKFMIWNLSPVWLIRHQDNFSDILQQNKIGRIHYPIQSGSSRILKEMKRYNDVDKISESLLFIKKHAPGVVLSTDIIVGYPGETEEDLKLTLDMIKSTKIDGVGIFRYNDASNTIASNASEKIDAKVIKYRVMQAQRILRKAGIECGIV